MNHAITACEPWSDSLTAKLCRCFLELFRSSFSNRSKRSSSVCVSYRLSSSSGQGMLGAVEPP